MIKNITVKTVLLKAMILGWCLALGLWPCTYYVITPVDYIQYNNASCKSWEINKTTGTCSLI